MIEEFFGNQAAVDTLAQLAASGRIPQTILLAGPEGVGKATLARRFAQVLTGEKERIEQDDLSRPANIALLTEREKWPAEKRNEDPLVLASYPDFLTFAPDGPLRQLSIPQMRLLKERAQFKPSRGNRRVFLIDQIDRANEQAANSLLKTLEEPPDHLIVFLTAENAFDLLPTIRSRAITLFLQPLSPAEMQQFARQRQLPEAERRLQLAGGSPGKALMLDLVAYDKRRTAMLALLQAAAGETGFSAWTKYSETIGNSKSEKLELYLPVLFSLLEDILLLQHDAGQLRNRDIAASLRALGQRVSLAWLQTAARKVDELAALLRRNIQKSIALDALVIELSDFAKGNAPAR